MSAILPMLSFIFFFLMSLSSSPRYLRHLRWCCHYHAASLIHFIYDYPHCHHFIRPLSLSQYLSFHIIIYHYRRLNTDTIIVVGHHFFIGRQLISCRYFIIITGLPAISIFDFRWHCHYAAAMPICAIISFTSLSFIIDCWCHCWPLILIDAHFFISSLLITPLLLITVASPSLLLLLSSFLMLGLLDWLSMPPFSPVIITYDTDIWFHLMADYAISLWHFISHFLHAIFVIDMRPLLSQRHFHRLSFMMLSFSFFFFFFSFIFLFLIMLSITLLSLFHYHCVVIFIDAVIFIAIAVFDAFHYARCHHH